MDYQEPVDRDQGTQTIRFPTVPRISDLHPKKGIERYLTRLDQYEQDSGRELTTFEVISGRCWFTALLQYHKFFPNSDAWDIERKPTRRSRN